MSGAGRGGSGSTVDFRLTQAAGSGITMSEIR